MKTFSIYGAACAVLAIASTSTLPALASSEALSSESVGSPLLERSFFSDAGLRMKRMSSRHRDATNKRDASTLMSGGDNNEGEDHGPVDVPDGAVFTSLPVGDDGEEVAVFWTENPKNSSASHAYVMIHGRLRNGNDYWTVMNDALQSALDDNVSGAGKSDIITAPQFYSTKYNSGQYSSQQLAWDDVNGWQAADYATHPTWTNKTSFDALTAFVTEFSNSDKYPKMQNLTFVGHGGGGQLIARYAQVAPDPPANLHIRYIVGDPSSNAYFTDDRPITDSSIAQISTCPYYNTWRYGFDNITLPFSPQAYFQRYVRRDVVSIVGYDDTAASGDTYCMANLQGGTARRDRNLLWYKLMHTLGGTDEDVSGFPGQFPKSLPDWSNMTDGKISLRLAVVENATHSASEVFGSEVGRSALFSDGDIETGWRPDGWKAASEAVTPGVTDVAGTNLMDGSSSNSSPSSSSSSSSSSSPSASASPSSTSSSSKPGQSNASTSQNGTVQSDSSTSAASSTHEGMYQCVMITCTLLCFGLATLI